MLKTALKLPSLDSRCGLNPFNGAAAHSFFASVGTGGGTQEQCCSVWKMCGKERLLVPTMLYHATAMPRVKEVSSCHDWGCCEMSTEPAESERPEDAGGLPGHQAAGASAATAVMKSSASSAEHFFGSNRSNNFEKSGCTEAASAESGPFITVRALPCSWACELQESSEQELDLLPRLPSPCGLFRHLRPTAAAPAEG